MFYFHVLSFPFKNLSFCFFSLFKCVSKANSEIILHKNFLHSNAQLFLSKRELQSSLGSSGNMTQLLLWESPTQKKTTLALIKIFYLRIQVYDFISTHFELCGRRDFSSVLKL